MDNLKKTPDWRSQATFEAYNEHIKQSHLNGDCKLCEAPTIATYTFWRLIPNNYPYDRVADLHHMIIPKRHTDGEDLTNAEQRELKELLKTDLTSFDYNYILQSMPKNMSIPSHLHYHLIKAKTFVEN